MSISRRNFLKGAGALGLAATGMFGTIAVAEEAKG
ncbi:MAG: twin-arginine translocation signal domain-containing protein [Oscillospiraceae bacterium]|nr:twin-arginine translocation signal domain-containing protein [Oscillospiraceae bacterium]